MLEQSLSPMVRLALAYAPARQRPAQLAAFALDARLAAIVVGAREPVLAQLKLAWLRDRLAEPAADRPTGEPLLAALSAWPGDTDPLAGLIDGWEAMLDDDPQTAVAHLLTARAALGRALADCAGAPHAAAQAAEALRAWTLAELGQVRDNRRRLHLPRALRALAVLYGLAGQQSDHSPAWLRGPIALATAMRIGIVGR